MSKKIEKIFEGANAEEQNVLLHIIKERGYEFFDNTPITTMSVLLLEDLHNLGYKIVKQEGRWEKKSNCTNFSNRKFIRPYFDGISTVVTQYQVWDELGQFWFQGTLSDCETYLNQNNDGEIN